MIKKRVHKKVHEDSFTLLEVIIAVAMLTTVVMQVVGGQGSLVEITDYSQKSTRAMWLAKRIMSEVEYFHQNRDFKDLEISIAKKDELFKDIPPEEQANADFRYNLEIAEWKFPIVALLTGESGPSEDEENSSKGSVDQEKPDALAGIPGISEMIDNIFEGEILKVANVEVSWPDGARRSSVALTLLLTNQRKLDAYIAIKGQQMENFKKAQNPNGLQDPKKPDPNARNPSNQNPSNGDGTIQ